jgi:hypothetical protein
LEAKIVGSGFVGVKPVNVDAMEMTQVRYMRRNIGMSVGKGD